MRGTSHLLIGGAIGAVLAYHTGAIPLGVASGAIGALLPDVDKANSTLGRYIPRFIWPEVKLPPTRTGFQKSGRRFMGMTVWHRGQCHSLGFIAIITLLLTVGYFSLSKQITFPGFLSDNYWLLFLICFGVGGVSHLVCDSINPSKMMFFWPFLHQMYTIPFIPKRKQDSGGGRAYEMLVTLVVLVLAILYIFHSSILGH